MRITRNLALLVAPVLLVAGCEAYVHTDAPPPAKVEVHPAPAAPTHVDVNVNRKPSGGVDVNVNKNP